MSTHSESDTISKPGHGDDHPFKVAVRSLAGHSDKVTVKPSGTVGAVTDKEVRLFVNKTVLSRPKRCRTCSRTTSSPAVGRPAPSVR